MKCKIISAVKTKKIIIDEREVKDPKPGEIQVRVHITLISPGTERAIILGLQNTDSKFPKHMGYSAAGVVEKTGSDVVRFKEGDRIACFCLNHCSLGNISEKYCMGFDDDLSYEQAVFLALGVICLQGVRKARIELGEAVMVLGLGPVGQLALQMSRANGALPAIGVDRTDSRLEKAVVSGADLTVNTNTKDWQQKIKEATGGAGPHVVIESTGFSEPVNMAFDVIRKFGRVSLLGSTREETTVNLYKTIHRKALTVTGAHIMGNPIAESRPGFWTWKEDADSFLNLLKHKKINVQHLITHQVNLDEAEGLYKKLMEWDANMMIPLINWV